MILGKVKKYIKKLERLESEDKWLPPPHEIGKYMDILEDYIDTYGYTDELFELEDQINTFYHRAYEQ